MEKQPYIKLHSNFIYLCIYLLTALAYTAATPTENNNTTTTINQTENSNNTDNFLDDLDCPSGEVFEYEKFEYEILQNESALVYGYIIPKRKYLITEDILWVCMENDSVSNETEINDNDNNNDHSSVLHTLQIYVTRIGSFISIIALIIHLIVFCYVPSLRNLPGYNLASLSLAFIFAYTFLLVGQIPQVVHILCIVSGILQYFFFFTAVFCMNVMAFDVWRTLRFTIQKLAVMDKDLRQFLWYSSYAWGCPLFFTVTLILLDNLDGIPEYIQPQFGKNEVCWMTNYYAQKLFYVFPVMVLFVFNAVFFVRSAIMISNNTMKCRNDYQKQTARFNYLLYLRLGLMMGATWILGVLCLIVDNEVIWFIYNLLNTLQGLFLFILFTCSKKVVKYVNENLSLKRLSEKRLSISSRTESG